MNTRRVAALLRELADELDGEAAPAPAKPRPPARPRRREVRVLTPPPNVTELDIARVRAKARKAGITIR